ncbi:MAG: methyltransferase [Candidatus Parabeggiatoa sp.]|nr:methyltransferase [Candidatus Parabeggiatoa sp.]
MTEFNLLIQDVLPGKRLSQVHDLVVITDEIDYPGVDQVFPMYPEQPFFLDELVKPKIQAANVLEIGLGSGVLSIGALKAGAKQVTALEINPRAKIFAGFNALLNGVEDALHITDGDIENIWAPVMGKTFDYIISNPPFMPTPPDSNHYLHSGGGGILGLDFVEKIFSRLDEHLAPNGHAQIVTAAPGDNQLPTTLLELANTYLTGSTLIKIDPLAFSFKVLKHHLPEGFSAEKIAEVNQQLQEKGISHQYLCVIHYAKGEKSITTLFSEPHPAWDMPLRSA